jgi:PAS domain S-box-containing protein
VPEWPGPGQIDLGFLDAFGDAALGVDARGLLVFVNRAAQRLIGVPIGELLGRPLEVALFDEANRDAFREVSMRVAEGNSWRGRLEVVRPDGTSEVAELSCSPFRHGGRIVGMVCVVSELGGTRSRVQTARRLADRLTGLAAVAAELSLAEDLETVTEVVTLEAAQAVGATVGSLSLLVDSESLVLAGLHGGLAGAASRWRRYSIYDNTPASDVARSGQPLVLVGREVIRKRYPQLERAAEGERSMVVLPLKVTGRTIGVMSWSFPGKRRLDVAEMEFYAVLADSCAQAVERIRAQE